MAQVTQVARRFLVEDPAGTIINVLAHTGGRSRASCRCARVCCRRERGRSSGSGGSCYPYQVVL